MLKRLTAAQYTNTVHDIFGDAVLVTDNLEPDTEVNGLYAVGASVGTVSPLGVEQYETSAYSIAEQALADADTRARLVPCTPTGVVDASCAAESLRPIGRQLYRRPLTEAELGVVVGLAGTAAKTLGDFHLGLEYGIAALLQSPHFLYRVELGEPDPANPGTYRYTSHEMATRLAYTLWNTTPDAALLDAADAGELVEDGPFEAQIDRMLADPRARDGVRNFFTEMFGLDALDDLTKDPTIFPHMSEQVGPSAREETLLGVEALVFEDDGDYRSLLTSQRTFLDRKLAAIYNVPAPAREGFGEAFLPEEGGRRGLLGQVSFLALNAHPTAASATRRGVFVREVLLCQDMPPPPAGVDTSIPEATGDVRTARDRLAVHLEDPYCAACHAFTDYIGLGLENFDGLGGWRDTDNGEVIDPSGELDGVAFANAWELAQVVREHQSLGPCLARTWYQYASARAVEDAEEGMIDWHAQGFADGGHRVSFLLRDLVTSPAFRRVGEVVR